MFYDLLLTLLTAFFLGVGTLSALPLASIIKLPPAKTGEVAYKDLACSQQDLASIAEIVTTLAENGKISLLLTHQSHLKFLGAQINHVHPLKLLATVITDVHLKNCMNEIFGDYFKRNGFMDGLGPSLERELEKGKLDQYLKDFSLEVGIPMETLKSYVAARDWENLVRFLLQP
ncbi:MAG: hypothetical protein V4487_00450 [Chlamydiota bacterium]